MADCSPACSQQASEINVLNFKGQFDRTEVTTHQSQQDNQEDSRAWAQLKLRVAQNAATIDHMTNTNAALSSHFVTMAAVQSTATAEETGQTENEQTVTPVRTGTGDAIVGGIGVSAEQVAANVANLATSLVPVIASALAAAISQSIAALVPVVVTAAGGASTPSQTKAPVSA